MAGDIGSLPSSCCSHKVVLDFHPQSLKNTETVAYIGYGVLALLIIIGVVVEVRKRKKE